MTATSFRWLFAIAAIVAIAWVYLTLPARAEWPRDAFTCHAYRADLYWQSWARRHCPGYRWRRWQHVPTASGDALCQPIVETIGEQAQSESAAFENALIMWRGRVRFKYGERYSNFKLARDPRRMCAPSSVPDAYRDQKLPPLFRCELSARPCRIEARPLNKDED